MHTYEDLNTHMQTCPADARREPALQRRFHAAAASSMRRRRLLLREHACWGQVQGLKPGMSQDRSREAAPDAISAATRHLHTKLLASPLAPDMAHVGAAEWWVHARNPAQPHQLHYDMDERFLGQGRGGYQLHHPVCCYFLQHECLAQPALVLLV